MRQGLGNKTSLAIWALFQTRLKRCSGFVVEVVDRLSARSTATSRDRLLSSRRKWQRTTILFGFLLFFLQPLLLALWNVDW
ncbi:hypothetical protein M758_4G103100 [Ceratodon purpureus]|nr:hypothetical protein M758_4G103100 [Ceratodon purpureus]